MKETVFTILQNKELCRGTYELTLAGDASGMRAGQFVELSLPGYFLRRPFGVCDSGNDTLTVLYKVAGRGTADMRKLEPGASLNALTALGNGFRPERAKKPLLIGGGIGIAPLYKLAKDFYKAGIEFSAILGYRNADEIFYKEEFEKLCRVYVTTDDGSACLKGNAVSCLMDETPDFDYYYACGPLVMLKNLAKTNPNGEISLEARMGCGFGACMGCTIKTKGGYKRVCKEGPVFDAGEVLFDD